MFATLVAQNGNLMEIMPLFLKELIRESQVTKKMLERVPEDHWDWRPHPKSMTLKQLATHLAELPTWIPMGLTTEEMDFAVTPYTPAKVESRRDLLDLFHSALEVGQTNLLPEYEDRLNEPWSLKNNGELLHRYTREELIRMVLNQIVHHRAQLGVYLRLLNIEIPASYGTSADDRNFV